MSLNLKSQSNFNFLLKGMFCILLLYLYVVSLNKKSISKRILEQNKPNKENYNYIVVENQTNFENKNTYKNRSSTKLGESLTVGFIIFISIAIYMLNRLHRIGQYEAYNKDFYFFLYMANNGTLIANGINIYILDKSSDKLDKILNYGPYWITSLIFILGSINLLIRLYKNWSREYLRQHYSFSFFVYVFKLIPFVWKLIGITGWSCGYIPYREHNTCLIFILNALIFYLKICSFLYTILSFSIFLIFYFMVWIIFKSNYEIIVFICFRENIQQNNRNNNNNDNNNNDNNNNDNNNNDNNNDNIRQDYHNHDRIRDNIDNNNNGYNVTPNYDVNINNNVTSNFDIGLHNNELSYERINIRRGQQESHEEREENSLPRQVNEKDSESKIRNNNNNNSESFSIFGQ